jgi:hypothetical protein
MRRSLVLIVSIVSVLFFGLSAFAQQVTGNIEGTITDQQRAVIASASVQLTEVATQVVRNAKTDASGHFLFSTLPPGTYSVQVEASGFKTTVKDLEVRVAETSSANLQLEVGSTAETVTVTASTENVNTVEASVDFSLHGQEVQDLPNLGRDALSISGFLPGVSMAGSSAQMAGNTGETANVDGNRQQRNDFYVDGMENQEYRNGSGQTPNPDAVEEVQVTTSNSGVELGKATGGVFNIVTKSGTNQFHGDGFYFFQLTNGNANSWMNDYYNGQAGKTVNSRPSSPEKYIGGTVGGPIRIPHLYNGKDKAFFFFAYDHYKTNSQGNADQSFAPTAAMLTGDFSDGFNTIIDPTTGQPFPGNKIPAGRIDPVGKNLASLFPTVSTYGPNNIFDWVFSQPAHNSNFLGKVDYHWNSKNTTTFTIGNNSGYNVAPNEGSSSWSNIPKWGPKVMNTTTKTYTGHHAWIISPNVFADFRLGYTDLNSASDNFAYEATPFYKAGESALAAAGAGSANVPVTMAGEELYLPQIAIGEWWWGHNLAGTEGWLGTFDQPSFHFGGTLSWTKQKHTFKFGMDSTRQQQLYADSFAPSTGDGWDGYFTCPTDQTSHDCQGSNNNTILGNGGLSDVIELNKNYNGIADLLLGLNNGYYTDNGELNYTTHRWDTSYFASDEWRITPRLTLSPGVRYEVFLPPTVSGNQRSEYYDPNGAVHGSKSTYTSDQYTGTPAGFAFGGDAVFGKDFYKTEYNLVSPRIGFAYDLKGDGKTAIRGGVGKYYSATSLQIVDWASEQMPWEPSVACSQRYQLSDPWNSCNFSYNPTTSILPSTITTNNVGGFSKPPTPLPPASSAASINSYPWPKQMGYAYSFDPNFKTAFSYQWNLSVEHQLGQSVSVTASYVGNRSRNLPSITDINWGDYVNGAPDPTIAGQWDFNSTSSNVVNRRPNQGYVNIWYISATAKSQYDAFQAIAKFHYTNRLTGQVSYTYQKAMDDCSYDPTGYTQACASNPSNIMMDWAQTANHTTLKFYYNYRLPILEHSSSLVAKVVSGWQLSGDGSASTGSPINVTMGDWNYDGDGQDRPDLAGPIQYQGGRHAGAGSRYFSWVSSPSFVNPGSSIGCPAGYMDCDAKHSGVFGTLKKNAVRGPDYNNLDTVLMKNFYVTSSRENFVQLRIESYNTLNHPLLGNPNLGFTPITWNENQKTGAWTENNSNPGNFGLINGKQASTARQMQFGVKYYF